MDLKVETRNGDVLAVGEVYVTVNMTCSGVPTGDIHVVGLLRFMSLTCPSELTHSFLFSSCVYFVLYGLSTIFHSTNPPDNSLLSHSVHPILCLPY